MVRCVLWASKFKRIARGSKFGHLLSSAKLQAHNERLSRDVRGGASGDVAPSASTCFHYFKLPHVRSLVKT